jgi:hypothetical protein
MKSVYVTCSFHPSCIDIFAEMPVETYKYLHNVHYAGCSTYFVKADQCGIKTRGHSCKLQKFSCRTRLRSNFYAVRTVNSWNSLPEEIVNAPSVNAFKNRLDKR